MFSMWYRDIFFNNSDQVTLLDYLVEVNELPEKNKTLCFGEGYCFSIGGFEIQLVRKTEKYLYNYFIPSGLIVVVSWV